jgi:hypothetical protein
MRKFIGYEMECWSVRIAWTAEGKIAAHPHSFLRVDPSEVGERLC